MKELCQMMQHDAEATGMHMQHKLFKLRCKRNIKLRGFAINLVLIVIVWLITLMPAYTNMAVQASGLNAVAVDMLVCSMLGIWKILAATFFLAPALAYWWEACHLRKHFEIMSEMHNGSHHRRK